MKQTIIKCFRTRQEKYFYDRYTNSIVCVNDAEYELLKRLETGDQTAKNSPLLRRYTKKGLLRESIVETIEHPETRNVHYLLENQMGQLILQVTQQCNLRCEYCAYSGKYNNRTHSKARMLYETAIKAIDFYIARSKEVERLNISFYGGEPLLEYDLIKKCVAYCKNKIFDKEVIYHMTCNGTLLSADVRKFVISNKFHLTISLDGNQMAHDKNRKYINGRGSFQSVIKNVSKLYDDDPLYYKQYVMFNSVINPNEEVENVWNFFQSGDLFFKGQVHFNGMITKDLKNPEDANYSRNFFVISRYEHLKQYMNMLGLLPEEKMHLSLYQDREKAKSEFERFHSHQEEVKCMHHSGPCIPGVRRVMVDVNGNLFPCERITELEDKARIGNIEDGFEEDNISNLLNIGKITCKECKICWNLRNCNICAALILNGESLYDTKLKQCFAAREDTLQKMRRMCILMESGYIGE